MRARAGLLYLHVTAIMLARAVLLILSSLPPDYPLTQLLKSDKLHCANVNLYLHYDTRICSNIDMAELARTHQKFSVLRADTASLRIEEVARADLYQIFQISKVSNHPLKLMI